jgi:hypothetical protein
MLLSSILISPIWPRWPEQLRSWLGNRDSTFSSTTPAS